MTTSTTVAEPSPSAFLSPKFWLAPYALMVSTLYLWGYWGTFDINVLDYIGVSDIIKAAVYPLVTGLIGLGVGALLGEVMAPRLEPGGGANTRLGKLLNAALPALGIGYVVLLLVSLMSDWPNKWLIAGVLVTGPIYLQLKKSAFLANEIPSDSVRSIVIFMLIMATPVAFYRGRLAGTAVVDGGSYQAVVSELPIKGSAANLAPAEKPRFVGKLGDRFAVYDPVARSVSLIAASEMKVLTLADSEVLSKAKPHAAAPASAPASSTGATSTPSPSSAPSAASAQPSSSSPLAKLVP
ncbi:hypothetical protein [Roseateles chitinivorans]|uniref:hypothetical protein n=1 Tax=Roseateles chitinivorans TaxID=2917965 RepID=UPI003D67C003